MQEITSNYYSIKQQLKNLELDLNVEKCFLISDYSNDFIIDEETGHEINSLQAERFFGQVINNEGRVDISLSKRFCGKVIALINKSDVSQGWRDSRCFK